MTGATRNILLVGVGGQGTILASKILSEALAAAGHDVKMAEIHGMSQRGGDVTTQIRYGAKVFSPIMGEGEADVIVAFEKLEALRSVRYMKPGGMFIVNDYEVATMPIQMGAEEYPKNIPETLSAAAEVRVVKAAVIAEGLGNVRAMNMVLLGALAKAIGFAEADFTELIRKSVKKGFADVNLRAFEAGMASI